MESGFFGFVLNADPTLKSASDRGNGWYRNSLFSILTPGMKELTPISNNEEVLPEGSKWACQRIEGGYAVETAIPISYLIEKQGENWKTIRFNAVIQDKDKEDTKIQRFTFQPEWRGRDNRIGSGMFFRE